ncbi:putative ATPase with chaperone activity, associated with Flp pilus assembly [Marinobacterium lacunae]|uniref:Putative ATPase with chaperone activity, associated with Flp pilus assembly n=2 Tax=Marinobacterium lacunae TaxID=1232683 RepID=A0A081G426_9GAMM|nr:putative ATPase with chaperone activity, associated with Flp pilus assembly [Marinobacterium lacunae]
MTTDQSMSAAVSAEGVQRSALEGLRTLAPRPLTLDDTGLSRHFLTELLIKHLYDAGLLTSKKLMQRTALAGPVLEGLIEFLRKEVLIDVHGQGFDNRELSYGLTQRGRDVAIDAFARSGYLGPAPVPVERYRELVRAQSVHGSKVTATSLNRVFESVVLRDALKEQLGPAMNSGRAIFIYGPAGTGKTYITQKLTGLFDDSCLIPYAISVNEQVVSLFDPLLHQPIEEAIHTPSLLFDQGYDARFVNCRRPRVVTGGELGMDMLEIHFNPVTKEFQAPLQLKANNGIFIIDDMGRQRATPMEIFNRWIVPMEEKRDYLTLGAGRHFQTPFDQILVFSSNINPLDLADEAFLRRIGYKIYFGYLERDEYAQIWQQVCAEKGIAFDPGLLEFAISELHARRDVALRPCHPRDLLGMAQDRVRYLGGDAASLDAQALTWAWDSYFVSLDAEVEMSPSPAAGRRNDHV